MKTVVGSFYTTTACLAKAPERIDASSWDAVNSIQKRFLQIFEMCRKDVERIGEIEVEVGRGTVEPVNAFIRRKNLGTQLNSIGPREIAVASILDLLVKWSFEGQPSMILREGREYPAAHLERGIRTLGVKGLADHVAVITARSGDRVLMTALAEQPEDAFEVFELSRKLVEGQEAAEIAWEFEGVKFPMIDLDTQPDIEWLIGMETNGWKISQALQQTRLKMNEKGAHMKEVAVMAAAAAPSQGPLIIDEPFLLVIQRPSLGCPLFSVFLAEDCWKNPGSLD